MSAVTIDEAWPTASQPFNVEVLDRMPDDGRRYELLDGSLVVSPRPVLAHQDVAGELSYVLRQVCPPELRVLSEPAVQLSADTEFVPDIVVIRRNKLRGARLTTPPLLAVEVRSPSTALIGLNRKKTAYERFGVPSYWIVVPDPAAPELIAFELDDGRYIQVAQVIGDKAFAASQPFAVTVVPADLVAALPGPDSD